MNPADLTLNTSLSLPTSLVQKNGSLLALARPLNPRVDLEPIYVQLKGALGDSWNDYKTAVNQFVLGNLNQSELSWVLSPLMTATPVVVGTDLAKPPVSTLYLHNTLLVGLLANIQRDPPPTEVAPWVVATDKPTSSSKNAGAGSGANDQAEERLKHEIITLHARDRKRIKALKETGRSINDGFREIQDYSQELTVRAPSHTQPQPTGPTPQSTTAAPGTGSGATSSLAKSNFGLEIRRRYAQPLACETLEFPSLTDLQNRIEPICYEEGLVGVQQGTLQGCAELIEQAAEVFIKEWLGKVIEQNWSNLAGPGGGADGGGNGSSSSGSGGGSGVKTHRFRRQLRKEEGDLERGVLQRNPAGLLPVEADAQTAREPLDMRDLGLSLRLRDPALRQDRFLAESVMLNQYPQVYSVVGAGHVNGAANGGAAAIVTNGVAHGGAAADVSSAAALDPADPDAMAVDDVFELPSFRGTAGPDHDGLMGVLDDCLLAAG